MKSVEEYAAMYRDEVQQHVTDEQVLASGVLSRPGSMGNVFVGMISPLVRLIRGRKAKRLSGGLPENVLAAVTPTKVIFFAFRPKMSSVVVKGRIREISRSGLRVSVGDGRLASRLTFTLGDGSTFELDSNRSMGQYQRLNDGLLDELGATVR